MGKTENKTEKTRTNIRYNDRQHRSRFFVITKTVLYKLETFAKHLW